VNRGKHHLSSESEGKQASEIFGCLAPICCWAGPTIVGFVGPLLSLLPYLQGFVNMRHFLNQSD
jgi:hypothetical protein